MDKHNISVYLWYYLCLHECGFRRLINGGPRETVFPRLKISAAAAQASEKTVKRSPKHSAKTHSWQKKRQARAGGRREAVCRREDTCKERLFSVYGGKKNPGKLAHKGSSVRMCER